MRDCLGLALRGHESGPKFVEFPRADLKSPAPRGPELKAPAAGVSLAAFGGLDLDPAKKENCKSYSAAVVGSSSLLLLSVRRSSLTPAWCHQRPCS